MPGLLFSLLLFSLTCVQAETEVHIRLTGQASTAPRLKVALPPFAVQNPGQEQEARLAHDLKAVVRDDLLFSRYFELLEDTIPLKESEWKTRGAGWLMSSKASLEGPRLTLTAKLVNLDSNEAVFERYYRQDSRYPRTLAHKLADDVVAALTGKIGVAQSQIVFSNNATGHKEIYVIDYDGDNLKRLTENRSISILPRFSPGRQSVAYTSYKNGNPDLFLLDLAKGQNRALSREQGLNIAGGFSPEGGQILLTLSRQKSPNLYVKALSDGTLTQLTFHHGADSSPTFSPDGSQAAFVSDRAGNPQIYILDITTHKAKRLTSLNLCDSPSWSPTGEWIAFSGRLNSKDKLNIFLVDVTGSQVRQLTRGEGANENPSWSADGRFLAFTSTRGNSGRPQLYLMDADGSAPRRLADIPGASFTPHWSN